MTTQLLEMQILEDIEGLIITDRVPYNGEVSAALYESVKFLRECWDIIHQSKYSDRVERFSQQAYNLTQKMAKISRSRTSGNVIMAIGSEIEELRDNLIETERMASKRTKSDDRASSLEKDLVKYQKLVRGMENRLKQFEMRAHEVEDAASRLSDAAEAKTSREWVEEYREYIEYDHSYKLRKVTTNTITKLKKVWLLYESEVIKLVHGFFVDLIFYNGQSYSNLARKYQFWRSFWMSLLLIFATVYLVAFWDYDFSKKDYLEFLADKSKFIPMLVMLTIGFVHASRKHRINLHLLEQYKHRYVVAKTMNNLMTLDGLKSEIITTELIQQGSKVLFEFKNAGYMSKGDKETLDYKSIVELLTRKES